MKHRTIETVHVSWARDGMLFEQLNVSHTKAREIVEALLARARGGEQISMIRRIAKTEHLLNVG